MIEFSNVSPARHAPGKSAEHVSDTVENFEKGLYDIKNGEFISLLQGEFDYLTLEETVTGISVFGINNPGELVTSGCAYVDRGGNEVQFTHPLYDECSGRGISSTGLISGYTIDDTGIWRGFIYDPRSDSFEDFLPDSKRNIAQGINSQGQVAGGAGAFDDREGYVRNSDGSVRLFQVFIDGVSYPTQARGISSNSMIVGTYTVNGVTNGFVGRVPKDSDDGDLIPDAVFTPGNTPECGNGVFLTRINNKGVITGICYTDAPYAEKGLLLTPRG